jgi:hypothetical protein
MKSQNDLDYCNSAVSFNFFVILEFWLTTTSQPRLTSMRDNARISIAYAFGVYCV